MEVHPFKKRFVSSYLKGIETITKPPYHLADIALARRFYSNLENSTFDTASFIIWNKNRRFKVTNNFPWDELIPKYLGNSIFGLMSIIEILPSFYEQLEEEEFELVNPTDDPSEIYVFQSRNTFFTKNYTKSELQKLNAGIIGKELQRDKAYTHPIWLALFSGCKPDLESFVEWVWGEKGYNEMAMGIYLQDPRKLCALTWKFRGLANYCNALATTGFNNDKYFLDVDSIQRKS